MTELRTGESHGISLPTQEITKENLSSILVQVNQLSTQKGVSGVAIPYLEEAIAKAAGINEFSGAMELTQVKFIFAQHVVMEEIARKLNASPKEIVKGRTEMRKSIEQMHDQIEKNGNDISLLLKARVYRFEGKYLEASLQFAKAEKAYKKGLVYFESSDKIEEKYNKLEFQAFISHTQLMQPLRPGKINEGLEMASKTLDDFDNSEEGKWLKENNYYMWAVWKSGHEIRIAKDMKRFHLKSNLISPEGMISDAKKILVMPNGSTSEFGHRLDELASL